MEEHPFEALEDLEKELARSYNQIAQEYNDPSHETLRDFELITLAFLKNALFHRVRPGQLVLDLGGGRGHVSRRLAELGSEVVLGDISSEMLKCTKLELGGLLNYCCLSAFRLPFREDVFDVVLSLLCEGYLNSKTIAEVYRVLTPRGLYVVTQTPRKVARASQQQNTVPVNRIWFRRNDGSVVLLPFSYVYALDELSCLLEKNGFAVSVKETMRPGSLVPEERLSTANRGVARALGSSPEEVPLLSALIAHKP